MSLHFGQMQVDVTGLDCTFSDLHLFFVIIHLVLHS